MNFPVKIGLLISTCILILSTVSGFQVSLDEGWNIVSGPENFEVSELSQDCDIKSVAGKEVWGFTDGSWTHHEVMRSGLGYYVYSDSSCSTDVKTRGSSSYSSFQQGWNLVSRSRDGSWSCGRSVNVWEFSGGQWQSAPGMDNMDPGKGYWVRTSGNCDQKKGSGGNEVYLDEGLVGYWNFDSDSPLEDLSGEGNNAENNGANLDSAGISGSAAGFLGSEDVIKVDHSDELGGMQGLTVSAWVKETGEPGDNWAHFVSKSGGTGKGDADWALIQDSTGDINFRANTGDTFDDSSVRGPELEREKWYHIVGVWDGSEMILYVDGDRVGTQALEGQITDSDSKLGIGRHPLNSDERYFTGKLDQLRIYERALSQGEISSLYSLHRNDSEPDRDENYTGPTDGPGIGPRTDYSQYDQYYVSPDGSSTASGTRNDPWNVEGAENNVGPGDVVNFLPGTYEAEIQPPSGDDGQPVVFRSDERLEALIKTEGFLIDGKSHFIAQGFRMDGYDWFRIKNSDHITIRDSYMTGTLDGHIPGRFWSSSHVKILNNVIKKGGDHNGITAGIAGSVSEVLISGNTISRAGHQPFAIFNYDKNENIAWRGNVFHNMVGRNGGSNAGGEHVMLEDNIYASAYESPKSGGPTAKLTVQHGIFRFNKLYRNWGTPIISSPYAEWNGPVRNLRIYNNVFSNDRGHGYRIFDRTEDYESVSGKIENNIFDSKGDAQAQVYLFGGIHNSGSDLDFTNNLFSGDPAVKHGDATYSVSGAENEYPETYFENIAGEAGFEDPENGEFSTKSQDVENNGAFLTKTAESGSGSTVKVEDSHYFHDGFEIEGLPGDRIRIDGNVVRVEQIDYSEDLLSLNESVSYEEGGPVSLPWEGSSPDMGVYEGVRSSPQIEVEAPMRAMIGEEVNFEAHIHGDIKIEEICWQFGDGKGTCGEKVTHTYSEPYDYGVRVRVQDQNGNYHWGNWYIFVSSSDVKTYSAEYRDSQVNKWGTES